MRMQIRVSSASIPFADAPLESQIKNPGLQKRKDGGSRPERGISRWVKFKRMRDSSAKSRPRNDDILAFSAACEACSAGRSIRCGGLAEIAHGINRGAIDATFVVDVRAGGASAYTDVANRIASVDLLADQDIQAGEMAVIGRKSVAVVDDHQTAIAGAVVGFDDYAIGGHAYLIAVLRGNIHAGMESAFPAKRVH